MSIPVNKIRADFPYLSGEPSLIYFDSASTTQKPRVVIDALTAYYSSVTSNVGRGIYHAAEQVTERYELARSTVAGFIGANPEEVIFTSGATQGINMIAGGWAVTHCGPGDEIVVTHMEHHSNLIPWQSVAKTTGATLKAIPLHADGTLDLTSLHTIITLHTKIVAVSHISNVTGALTDLEAVITRAHEVGAKVLVDASQSVPHMKLDIHEIGCDFLVFSGHKVLGPTGIGALFIRKDIQNETMPMQLGGGMLGQADLYTADWRPGPYRFEGGTPPIAQAIGLAAALNYLKPHITDTKRMTHESALCKQFIQGLQAIKGVNILGPVDELAQRGHLVSFFMEGMHAHDIAAYLDRHGIAVRAGYHCAYPLAQALNWPPSVRVSFYVYNTEQEVARCLEVLQSIHQSL